MTITKQEVQIVAKLANIELTDIEVQAYTGELEKIFGFVEQLSEVNTQGVEPLASTVGDYADMRPDVVADGGIRDAVLANAPVSRYGYFIVPKVIE